MKFKLNHDEKDYIKRSYIHILLILFFIFFVMLGAWFIEHITLEEMNIGFLIYVFVILSSIPWIFILLGRTKWFN
jgi:hypothetical protein